MIELKIKNKKLHRFSKNLLVIKEYIICEYKNVISRKKIEYLECL